LFNPEPAATADFTRHITALIQSPPKPYSLTSSLPAVAAGSGLNDLNAATANFTWHITSYIQSPPKPYSLTGSLPAVAVGSGLNLF
jgi:hypothetical protein